MASARDGQGAEYFALISNDVIGFTSYEPQSPLVPPPSDGWAATYYDLTRGPSR